MVEYDRGRIANAILKATTAAGSPNAGLAQAMAEKVEASLIHTYSSPAGSRPAGESGGDAVPSVEDIQDVVENVLIENRLSRIAKSYIIYRHQHAMARAAKAYEFEVTDNVPYRKLYEVLRWNMEHRCDSVESLNKTVVRGKFPQLVQECDRRYAEEVNLAAARILQDLKNIRIVIIAGPSSSGKTTTTFKISEQLRKAGVGFKAINIDHYFFDLDRHPVDEFGDHDYETPGALDLELINKHLVALLDGKTVKTPHYDFKTGLRRLNAHEFTLAKDEILLIDSLHGLYDGMTQSIPAERKFKLYIETLGQFRMADGTFMRWSDNRLLRRMNRDKDHRNLKPLQTLTHWHYVRKSELKHIIPFIKHADCIVNSALPYELPIFKRNLFKYFTKAIDSYKDDPRRLDAHIRANRIYSLLRPLRMAKDDSCIPPDSLLREFIGGSGYKY